LFADDLHDKDYKGSGPFMILVCKKPPIHDVQVDHVTAFVTGALLAIVNAGDKLPNFAITNSVFLVGDRRLPMVSAGGGADACASRTQVLGSEAVLQACFDPYKFEKNLIITARGTFPKGNFVVGSPGAAGIRDLKGTAAPRPPPERWLLPMVVTWAQTLTRSKPPLQGWNRKSVRGCTPSSSFDQTAAHNCRCKFARQAVVEKSNLSDRYEVQVGELEGAVSYQPLELRHRHLVQPAGHFAESRCPVRLKSRPPTDKRFLAEQQVRPGENGEQMTAQGVIPGGPESDEHFA